MSFAENIGKNTGKNISKNVSGKNRQKLLDHAKQSTTCTVKATSKGVIQKTAEATDEFIGNEITDKITKFSRTSSHNTSETVSSETEVIEFDAKIPKERHVLLEKRLAKIY